MTSAGVSPRACICSGSSQTRMLYSPIPKTKTSPTPGNRAQLVLHADGGVVVEEQAVVGFVAAT